MKIFNTLGKEIQEFKPQINKKVTLYVCGITPYDTTHLGHAFTYISFDVLIRYLEYKGYLVTYTQNVTDINDRDKDILQRAKEQNISWKDLASYWTRQFLDDMHMLSWRKPDYYLKASEQIPTMLKLIDTLIQKGIAYQKEGYVFLDISKADHFGKLSQFSREEMLKTSKEFEEDIENPLKRNLLDITLWAASAANTPAHIPSFDSPYGAGRPGWHLECSAMGMSTLGEQIDIHGGGIDLIFPHHESEIVQSESATGKIPFAKYWMHTGQVDYKGEKMSKSKGNLVMVSSLLGNYSPNAIRWLLLSHHYRKGWEYFEEDIQVAQQKTFQIAMVLKKTCFCDKNATEKHGIDPKIVAKFESFMENDLQTPKTLELIDRTSQLLDKETDPKTCAMLHYTLEKMLVTLGFSPNHLI